MKALVLESYNSFAYKDVDAPDIGSNDVLVEVKACGICGSDVHGMDGSTGRRQPPIIMGHEAAGIIAEAGKNVTDWKKGDRVTFDSTVYCGKCIFCRKGQTNLCNSRHVLGVSCDDYHRDGAFARFVAVPDYILYRLPEKLSFESATMVEALSIAVHAVKRTPVSLNDSVVVVGVGVIGLLIVQAVRAAGCGTLIAVDLEQGKLDLALKLGADVGLKSDQCDVSGQVRKYTGGYGADIAFEAVGISQTVNMAIEALRKGGSLTLVGNLCSKVELPLQNVVTRELCLSGSCASSGEYPACLDMIARGQINVDILISKTAPLSQGAAWFDRLYNRQSDLIKVVLCP